MACGRVFSFAEPMFLQGTHDPFFRPESAGKELASLIPGARYLEFSGGHNFGNHDKVFDLIMAAVIEHMTVHDK